MESWEDQGLVLNMRSHGEGGAVLTLFTQQQGLHAGYIHGAHSSAKRPMLERGNLLQVQWRAQNHDQLGTFQCEVLQQNAALLMGDRHKLSMLHSLCALLAETLPEREAHYDLFDTTCALLLVMSHSADDINAWGDSYIKWEIALLRELGFSLDFSKCAGGGDARELAYISPKSGCAVSYSAGEAYKDKLLSLPAFLKPNGGPVDGDEIAKGLQMTGVFLEKWVFAHHTKGVPDARKALDILISDIAHTAITG